MSFLEPKTDKQITIVRIVQEFARNGVELRLPNMGGRIENVIYDVAIAVDTFNNEVNKVIGQLNAKSEEILKRTYSLIIKPRPYLEIRALKP